MWSMRSIISGLCLVVALSLPGVLLAQQQPQGRQQGGPPVRDNSTFVVFIHAGGKDYVDEKSVREIAVALLGKRFVVRAPDKERDEVGGPGVDYFAKSAREAAQEVANTVNDKLKSLNLLTDETKALKPRLQRLKESSRLSRRVAVLTGVTAPDHAALTCPASQPSIARLRVRPQ